MLAACGGQPERSFSPHAEGVPLFVMVSSTGAAVNELRAGRLAGARTQLEEALTRNPDGLSSLSDLALSYAMEERFDAARHLLEEVLARGTLRDQQVALVNLGELYALEGYLTAAAAHLSSALAIDPGRAEPAYALWLLSDVRGDRAGAALFQREALEADRSGAARKDLIFLYPEERLHVEALVAEGSGEVGNATSRWRELARGRFQTLAQVAQRHLEEP